MYHLPRFLLTKEYLWEKVNSKLYGKLFQGIGNENSLGELLNLQKEQEKILQFFLHSYRGSVPSLPENTKLYEDKPDMLLKELINREEELYIVYQSYDYFLGYHPTVSPTLQRLLSIQNRQIDLLKQWKNHFPDQQQQSQNGKQYWLEEGYELELVASELTFPSSIVFDDDGELYIGEAGFSYGPAAAEARILHLQKDGNIREVASGFDKILTGLGWHNGYFYVVTGDFDGKVYRVTKDGNKEVLIRGLRGGGDHYTSDIAFGPDGKMYFAVGTTTNSAVVGEDNLGMGWLGRNKDYHDIPARDIQLFGRNYETPNFFTKTQTEDKAVTGAYHPFNVPSVSGEIIQGHLLANGVLYRANPDGSQLEIVADGFRNLFGLSFSPDGRLFGTNNGFDFRGSRPIEGDWDTFYELTPGWYGWPDFGSGLPVTLPYFKPPGHDQPKFLLSNHPPIATEPLIRFAPHTATQKFDFCTNESFGTNGEMFFAQFGDQSPMTGLVPETRGYRVVKVNPITGQVKDFLINLSPGETGSGPQRPIAPRFSPDGKALYVLDFGLMKVATGVMYPYAKTGAVWRIKPKQ